LRSLGAEVVEHADFETWIDDIWTPNAKIVYALDFKTGLKRYLSQLIKNPNNINDIHDLIEYTKRDPREDFPKRSIDLWLKAASMPEEDNTSERFRRAYEEHLKDGTIGGVTGVLQRFKLDALVMPTDMGSHAAGPAGLPVLTIPLGHYPADVDFLAKRGHLWDTAPTVPYVDCRIIWESTNGFGRFGISFIGDKFSEETLLKFGFDYEQATKRACGPRPYLAPNIELRPKSTSHVISTAIHPVL
jgi:amidase